MKVQKIEKAGAFLLLPDRDIEKRQEELLGDFGKNTKARANF